MQHPPKIKEKKSMPTRRLVLILTLAALLIAPIFALAMVNGSMATVAEPLPANYWSFTQDWRDIASGESGLTVTAAEKALVDGGMLVKLADGSVCTMRGKKIHPGESIILDDRYRVEVTAG